MLTPTDLLIRYPSMNQRVPLIEIYFVTPMIMEKRATRALDTFIYNATILSAKKRAAESNVCVDF